MGAFLWSGEVLCLLAGFKKVSYMVLMSQCNVTSVSTVNNTEILLGCEPVWKITQGVLSRRFGLKCLLLEEMLTGRCRRRCGAAAAGGCAAAAGPPSPAPPAAGRPHTAAGSP